MRSDVVELLIVWQFYFLFFLCMKSIKIINVIFLQISSMNRNLNISWNPQKSKSSKHSQHDLHYFIECSLNIKSLKEKLKTTTFIFQIFQTLYGFFEIFENCWNLNRTFRILEEQLDKIIRCTTESANGN